MINNDSSQLNHVRTMYIEVLPPSGELIAEQSTAAPEHGTPMAHGPAAQQSAILNSLPLSAAGSIELAAAEPAGMSEAPPVSPHHALRNLLNDPPPGVTIKGQGIPKGAAEVSCFITHKALFPQMALRNVPGEKAAFTLHADSASGKDPKITEYVDKVAHAVTKPDVTFVEENFRGTDSSPNKESLMKLLAATDQGKRALFHGQIGEQKATLEAASNKELGLHTANPDTTRLSSAGTEAPRNFNAMLGVRQRSATK